MMPPIGSEPVGLGTVGKYPVPKYPVPKPSAQMEGRFLRVFLLMRAYHVFSGLLTLVFDRRRFVRRRLGWLVFALVTGESTWLARRALRRGHYADAASAAVDVGVVGASLVLCSALTAASVEDFDARVTILPAVVILDLGLPGMRGGQAVEHLCRRGMKVLVVSAQGERDSVVDALGAGASGYLTKSSEPAEIATAVRAIANGQTYVSPTLASYLLQSAKGTSALDLSKREIELLKWLAKGLRIHARLDRAL